MKPGHVPVIDASGWSEARFRAFVIADNKLGERSTWDRGTLADEMRELLDDGLPPEMLAFEQNEIDQLFGDFTGGADELPLDANAAGSSEPGGQSGDDPPDTGNPSHGSGKAPPILIPLLINLTPADMKRWREIKKANGLDDNTAAFRRMAGIEEPAP